MGQQQFLLLVLAILIVGLATQIAVEIFSRGQRNVEVDMVVYNLARAVSTAQEWKLRPASYGGGRSAPGFVGVETGLERLGWAPVRQTVTTTTPGTSGDTDCYQSDETTIYCAVPDAGRLTIFAFSSRRLRHRAGGMTIVAQAVVSGTLPGDVEVTVE